MSSPTSVCVRCQKPVVVNRSQYETFEKMHWLCFHLEYEHDADPDEPCGDISSCPWWQIEFLKQELVRLGRDPKEALERALNNAFDSSPAT
jgi:hypothetical protein